MNASAGNVADGGADAEEKALSAYLHDLSPVVEGWTVDTAVMEHVVIPTSTGIALDGWVRRPPGDGEFPTILYFTPYYGGGDPSSPLNVLGDLTYAAAQYFIPRGYAVGLVSVRGTGNSSGCYTSGGEDERRELGEAVEHIAALPWSNKRIGAIGVSFDGATAAELFTEAPPSLKTVVPIAAVTDYYRYGFNNGILRFINGAYPTYYVAVSDLLPVGLSGGVGPADPEGFLTRAVAGLVCPEQITAQLNSIENVLTAEKTPFWIERDLPRIVAETAHKPRPSMFYIQGFQDANVDTLHTHDWLSAVDQTGVPLHVWLGQWVHAYPQSSSGLACESGEPCRGDFWEQALLAWFDQFLKGVDTGILDAPAVQLQADDGVWRHEDAWPPSASTPTSFYPQADGTLGLEASSGVVAFRDNLVSVPTQLPVDQSLLPEPITGTALVFVSEPLEQDLRLTGTPRLQTLALSSAFKANLVATLLARKPDGTQRYINFAAVSLNHAVSLENADTNISGTEIPVDVHFLPQDNVIPAGEQLVLEISGNISQDHVEDDGNSANLLNYGARLMPLGVGADVMLDLAATKLTLMSNPNDRVEPLSWLEQP